MDKTYETYDENFFKHLATKHEARLEGMTIGYSRAFGDINIGRFFFELEQIIGADHLNEAQWTQIEELLENIYKEGHAKLVHMFDMTVKIRGDGTENIYPTYEQPGYEAYKK